MPSVQNKIKQRGEKELSQFLKTNVSIGSISIEPFNQVVLFNVKVPDQKGDSLFNIDKLGAGISIYNLIAKRKFVFTYGEIIGLHASITRPDKSSPTNMQFIIDALKPKPNQPPKNIDLKIYNIVIRKSELSYDVLSESPKIGRFDANHAHIYNLRADLALPKIRNNDYIVDVKRLSFNEKSGLILNNLTSNIAVNDKQMSLSGLLIELPNSMITIDNTKLNYSSLKNFGKEIKNQKFNINIANSYIALNDLKCFVPAFKNFTEPFHITVSLRGNLNDLRIPVMQVATNNNRLSLELNGRITDMSNGSKMSLNIPHLKLLANSKEIAVLTSNIISLSPSVKSIITNCGNVHVDGSFNGRLRAFKFAGNVETSIGNVLLNGAFAKDQLAGLHHFKGHVDTKGFNVGKLLSKQNLLEEVAMNANVDATSNKKLLAGKFNGDIAYIDFKGYRYKNIKANVEDKNDSYKGDVSINDPNGNVKLNGVVSLNGKNSLFDFKLKAANLNLAKLNLYKHNADKQLSFDLISSFKGNNIDNATGFATLSNVAFVSSNNSGIHLKKVEILANNKDVPHRIDMTSDFCNGSINGYCDFKTILPEFKKMLSQAFPNVFDNNAKFNSRNNGPNIFNFDFTVEPNDELEAFLKLPVRLIYKATVSGNINSRDNNFNLRVNVPYLQQGNKIIEGTSVFATLDSVNNNVKLTAHTLMPVKNGKAMVDVDANGINNKIDSNVKWKVNSSSDYHGSINATTTLHRNADKSIDFMIGLNPTNIVFNDTSWQVLKGKVDILKNTINVDNLVAQSDKQFVKINGTVSKNAQDQLCVELNDINLDYIFGTLNISNVDFGGRATGKFFASDLYSKSPRLSTPDLHIENMSYNNALMGNGDIESHWDNANKAVDINAKISQKNGLMTAINGYIIPSADSIYMNFKPQKANVAFLKPFMAAFTSDLKGEVSGNAVLYGNFHNINLYGDILAENLKLKVDYTNVYYTCTDSVHMRPGLITFNNIEIHDRDGNKAELTGWLKHDYFHRPSFNFAITNARNFLCYDINQTMNPDWFGTIYGNGSAFISGEPGVVKVSVNMESAAKSKFTFVMSDTQEASAYNFITFRDPKKLNAPVVTNDNDSVPEVVRKLAQKNNSTEQSLPTNYYIDLQADITPDAQMTLIMDPVGGDKIRATGRGNLRMTYNNADEKLGMFGKYTLEKGNYNFTLQDIIIKDFTIKDGSSISFQGDPYSAILDIEAIYSLNANIKDLDESFATDKEINRTNVPVHALLKAKGVVSQPDISFDLEFPTLTSDAYRKIKSIISTDDMMNRQIIYLLALNRFYTPEYMNNSSKNNELTSVASSTLSSQLSNILGQISDNWSISPNFRSNKGDFSDMEVDLALSSQLLNNRLLFNGNFGYRDNSINTRNSNFIGDFDIEYLLNKRGTIRLKAYNHFNDQNYYVRNAMTTQGVGVVFKYDFDHLFDRNKSRMFLLRSDSLGSDKTKSSKAIINTKK
jgi:hypothetical protein